jgi:hypothetical protein
VPKQRPAHLAAQQADALPQRLQHVVKGLDAVGGRRLRQRSNGQRRDGLHLLVLVLQACGEQLKRAGRGRKGKGGREEEFSRE